MRVFFCPDKSDTVPETPSVCSMKKKKKGKELLRRRNNLARKNGGDVFFFQGQKLLPSTTK